MGTSSPTAASLPALGPSPPAWGKMEMGVNEDGREIAVKILHFNGFSGVDSEHFQNEVYSMGMIQHENIVRLVGYCDETEKLRVEHHGVAEKFHRALCFEYLQNGSLTKHISSGKPKRFASSLLRLRNKEDHHVAFRLVSKGQKMYHTNLPLLGIVPPKCTYTIALRMSNQQKRPQLDGDEGLLVQSVAVSRQQCLDQASVVREFQSHFNKAQESDDDEVQEQEVTLEFVSSPPTEEASSKEWIVAGDGNGCIHVFGYDEYQDTTSFEAHNGQIMSLAVHPKNSYVLSSSHEDHLIKLWHWDKYWDFEKGPWVCTRTFEGHSNKVSHVIFNPDGTDSFASASWDGTVKIWDWGLNSDVCNTITLDAHPDGLLCIDYITGADPQHLITGSKDQTAQIWDLKIKRCREFLQGHAHHVSVVYCHQELHKLFTGSLDGTVRIWDSMTYRLENIIALNLGAVSDVGYIDELQSSSSGFQIDGRDTFCESIRDLRKCAVGLPAGPK
ncbi:unnamed protein product [Miscanthus lutarioriparius]|uniref:Serine-threonine/tyrosine-protein kinase catalytic domain-containing protein n=1 Tax=Miscanthus lutarioriparius TaxID=422564 RepID=A0A811QG68_9POAL|nr:unnamed protein product [Miscanthus lutarioriparius]